MKPSRSIRRATVAVTIAAVPFALGSVTSAAGASPTALRAAPVGDCDWFDPAAVVDLPVDEAVDELDELSTFHAAIAAAGLDEQLAGDGPWTIFAPSNQAMDAIPANVFDSMLADLDLLSSILQYHVVTADALTAEQLAESGSVATLNGDLTVTIDGETMLIDGTATVTCAGIETANATIYVIDRVLQPATDSMCPSDSGVPGSSVPATSVPATSVPGTSAPDISVPDVSVPGSTVPPC